VFCYEGTLRVHFARNFEVTEWAVRPFLNQLVYNVRNCQRQNSQFLEKYKIGILKKTFVLQVQVQYITIG
jgi:hypothetical protein